MEVNLEQSAYEQLRRELQTGKFVPGDRLSAIALSKKIGMSRTPVTQALRRLGSEGLVQQVPHLGTFVRKPNREEIAELFEIRIALESHSVAAAVDRVTPQHTDLLEALCDRLAAAGNAMGNAEGKIDEKILKEVIEADLGFHLVILRVVGNHRLLKLVADYQIITRPFAFRIAGDAAMWAERLQQIVLEHRAILTAIKARDANAARDAVIVHLRDGLRRILAEYDRLHLKGHDTFDGSTWPDSVAEAMARIENEGLGVRG